MKSVRGQLLWSDDLSDTEVGDLDLTASGGEGRENPSGGKPGGSHQKWLHGCSGIFRDRAISPRDTPGQGGAQGDSKWVKNPSKMEINGCIHAVIFLHN